MRRAALLAALMLVACKTQIPDWSRMTAEQRRQTIFAASEKCHLPMDRFKVGDGNRLIFNPQPGDDYRNVDCALREVFRVKPDIGFIGNEAPANSQ